MNPNISICRNVVINRYTGGRSVVYGIYGGGRIAGAHTDNSSRTLGLIPPAALSLRRDVRFLTSSRLLRIAPGSVELHGAVLSGNLHLGTRDHGGWGVTGATGHSHGDLTETFFSVQRDRLPPLCYGSTTGVVRLVGSLEEHNVRGTKLCVRVPFYGDGYPCYSFCSNGCSHRTTRGCTDRLVSRFYGCNNTRFSAICFNNNAPDILRPQLVTGVLRTTQGDFGVTSGSRVAVRYGPSGSLGRSVRVCTTDKVGEVSLNVRDTIGTRQRTLNEVTKGRRVIHALSCTERYNVAGVDLSLVLNIPGRAPRDLSRDLSFVRGTRIPRISTCVLGVRRNAPFCELGRGLPLPSRRRATRVCLGAISHLRGVNVVRCRVDGFTGPNFRDGRGAGC